MQHVVRAVPVGEFHGNDLCAKRKEQFGELSNTGGVGSETAAGEQGIVIEPDHVASLRGRSAFDETENRHLTTPKGVSKSRTFAATRNFPGLKNYSTAIGYQHRIVHVKRIQAGAVIRRKIENLRARFRDQ